MNTDQILTAFKVPVNSYTKIHAGKLAKIYSFLVNIKASIVKSEIVETGIDFFFGKSSEDGLPKISYAWAKYYSDNNGEKLTGNKIRVTTNTGSYSFIVAPHNIFYNEICNLLDLPFSKMEVVRKVKREIELPVIVLDKIKKAARFASDDDLRPSMMCVCLRFENNTLEVVATDAHRLYMSELIQCKSGKKIFSLMLTPDSVKKLKDIKPTEESISLSIISDTEAIIAGVSVSLLEGNFPDYKVVVQPYKTKMKVDRNDLVTNIKRVLPAANKSTCQVLFDIADQLFLSAQDVDFSFEHIHRMNHCGKDFSNMQIAFNGKFVIGALSIFKEKEIDMYSDGKPTKMGIFTNGKDRVAIMPLMLPGQHY